MGPIKNILVTGGAGFIGSHTVVELAAAGFKPIVLDNLSNSEVEVIERLSRLTGQQITFYKGEFQDKKLLNKVIETESIAGVIHFAAFKAVGESVELPLKYFDNNVSGFTDLLAVLLEKNINNIVFSSSAAVYGNPPTDKVDETTICRPASPYGWSKYMDEVILEAVCKANNQIKGVALRYFNVVGSHDSHLIGEMLGGKPQNLLPIIVQATAGKIPPLTVHGTDYPTPDGTCLRDYIHVVDLAKAHVAALNYIESENDDNYFVYNIGTGQPTSVLELIKTFESTNNVKVPYELGPRRPGDPTAYYALTDKAEKDLGWKAVKTTADAVRDAWEWQKTATKTK